jgi:hypothetical protein
VIRRFPFVLCPLALNSWKRQFFLRVKLRRSHIISYHISPTCSFAHPLTTQMNRLNDLLLDLTIASLYEDCNCKKRVACEHSHSLFSCLLVSKDWFNLAVKHLWEIYAGVEDLFELLCPFFHYSTQNVSKMYFHTELNLNCQNRSIPRF